MADHRAVHADNSGLGAVLFVLAAIATVLGWTGTRAKTTTEPSPQEAVYSLSPNDTIRQALHMFVDKRISGAPLLSDDRTLAGFVSDGDVLDVIGDSVPAFTTPYALLAHNDSTEFGTDVAAVLDRPVSSLATMTPSFVVGIINRSDINRYLVSTFVPVAG